MMTAYCCLKLVRVMLADLDCDGLLMEWLIDNQLLTPADKRLQIFLLSI
jgi:hypothetical protein